jgi:hypothetical protein
MLHAYSLKPINPYPRYHTLVDLIISPTSIAYSKNTGIVHPKSSNKVIPIKIPTYYKAYSIN